MTLSILRIGVSMSYVSCSIGFTSRDNSIKSRHCSIAMVACMGKSHRKSKHATVIRSEASPATGDQYHAEGAKGRPLPINDGQVFRVVFASATGRIGPASAFHASPRPSPPPLPPGALPQKSEFSVKLIYFEH